VIGTAKPLAEIEPRTAINATNTPGNASALFVISQPGSYYLTGNITGVSGRGGILITASNVTIDLNGFALSGVSGSTTGISITGFSIGLRICNGRVSDWGGAGIDLITSSEGLIDHVTSSVNGGTAIRSGIFTVIRDCAVTTNTGAGIVALDGCVVEGCSVGNISGLGISMGNGVTVRGCAVQSCSGGGIRSLTKGVITDCSSNLNTGFGINAASTTVVRGCACSGNTVDGILAAAGCTILENNCNANGTSGTGAGVRITGAGSRVEANTCIGGPRGIDIAGTGNIVVRNTCSGSALNWNIVAGNAVAPITVATTNGAVISGNSYAGSLGSNDPNANFTY
jgi:hypothetical protein